MRSRACSTAISSGSATAIPDPCAIPISVFSYGLPYESESPRLCRVSGLTSAMATAWGKASLDSRASAELRCKIGRSSPKRNRHLEGTGSFAFHTPIRRSRLCRRHPLRPVPQAHLRPACGRAGDDVPRGDGGVRYCALRHPPSRRSPETLRPNPVRPPAVPPSAVRRRGRRVPSPRRDLSGRRAPDGRPKPTAHTRGPYRASPATGASPLRAP